MGLKENFDVYVGCTSGVFKGIKVDKKGCEIKNIQNLVSITDHDKVTSMSWGDDEEKEILLACGVKGVRSVKVYDVDCSIFTCSFFCNIGTGRINGISRYDEAILTAVHSGEVKLWRFKEEDQILIKAGENLNKMRHSKVNKNIIATGGEEHMLKLFDLNRQVQTFIEKNVPHDWLELKVPVWISDIEFLPGTEQIVTTSRYGHVRLYDPKVQRRPVLSVELENEPLTTLSVVPREKQIIVGSGKGKMNLIDLRKSSKVLNTYKGFLGGVTGISCSTSEPYVVSVSLDRHLRVHHIDTKELLKQVYLTSKMSCMLLRSGFSFTTANEINEESTQGRDNKIGKNAEIEKQNEHRNSDSDLEYDTLFKSMPVVGNKKDETLIKRKKIKRDSLLDNEIVSHKSTLRKSEKPEKSSKKVKKSNLTDIV
ncbi:PREDICTED: WD repeat-containing protein 74 [Habropoda laboriosa]|uniref:WD repeat-containing protein 74 n=1 Tax=Habropoda laboriosa TaxID=597456 RepID=UPI00083D6C82|nr:PREDICTED: WD repeat-containing protein 74 [Habropoda laboriosa]